MDQPQVPDAVDPATLAGFLAKASAIPLSPVIPQLAFPPDNSHQGLMDLHLVLLQVIFASQDSGPTPLQMLACCHGMTQHLCDLLRSHVDEPDQAVIDAILKQLPPAERGKVETVVERVTGRLKQTLRRLEVTAELLGELQGQWLNDAVLIERLASQGLVPPVDTPTPGQRAISDHILESLQLDRSQVESWLQPRS